ncbi:MAG: hypothetical protein Q4F72_01505, partial [Desulfovibrionaceae bacterium]|nr:hypothetical protein [Desulfovibrionaceae bacterium]
LLGAGAIFKSSVEDMTADAIMSIAGTADTDIDSVEFSPLKRQIRVTGWRSTYTSGPQTLTMKGGPAEADVTLRGLFTCLPLLGNLFFDADSSVPVLENLTVRDISWSGRDFASSAERLEVKTVNLVYSLAQQYASGLRPPFAKAVNGVHADRLVMSGFSHELRSRARSGRVSADSIEAVDMRGSCAQRITARGLSIEPGDFRLAMDSLTLSDVRVSPELLSELVAFGRAPAPTPPPSLEQGLVDNGPLLSRAAAENAVYTAEGLPPVSVEGCELEWKGGSLEADLHVRGLSFPAAVLSDNLPISMGGISEVRVDADLSTAGVNESREQGEIRAAGLGSLRYDFVVDADASTVRDLSLTWTDAGLTARVAHAYMPDAHAAGMLLKAGAGSLCRGDGEADRVQCGRLADFVDAPGTVTLSTAKGRVLHGAEFAAILGRFGSLFEVRNEPGAASLTVQSERLFPVSLPRSGAAADKEAGRQ